MESGSGEVRKEYENFEWLGLTAKIAAFRASSCVVNVISYYKHDKAYKRTRYLSIDLTLFGDRVESFAGSGIIIECEQCSDATYSTIILTHANLFMRRGCAPIPPNEIEIVPDDKVIALSRTKDNPDDRHFFEITVGHFSMKRPSINCNELFGVKGIDGDKYNGGPVINYSGEVIGIMFHESSFLPSNIISRWWKHYKTYREFRRPRIGFRVVNLYTAQAGFLEQLIRKFPSFSTGVLVLKVEEDSPAYCSGICDFDAIIQINGVVVQGTLEFFEKTWDKVGESVELIVLRESTGDQLNISTTIGEATPEKFPEWVSTYTEWLNMKKME